MVCVRETDQSASVSRMHVIAEVASSVVGLYPIGPESGHRKDTKSRHAIPPLKSCMHVPLVTDLLVLAWK